jgi:hypothetical protein
MSCFKLWAVISLLLSTEMVLGLRPVEITSHFEDGTVLGTFDSTNFPTYEQYNVKYFLIGEGQIELELCKRTSFRFHQF